MRDKIFRFSNRKEIITTGPIFFPNLKIGNVTKSKEIKIRLKPIVLIQNKHFLSIHDHGEHGFLDGR